MTAPRPLATTNATGRRTRIVWATLGGAMTLVGGLLVALEDAPAPRMDGLALAATPPAAGATPIEAIFGVRAELDEDRWLGVVVHHSGSAHGSPTSVARAHEARGLQGLGHHFVIGNGNGSDDGELHVGYRWLDQLPGAHTGGPDQDFYNRRYIGVCLIGDGDRRAFTPAQLTRLTQLVGTLRRRLNIPVEQVVLHRDISGATSPGVVFPEAWFRGAIASAEGPGEVQASN